MAHKIVQLFCFYWKEINFVDTLYTSAAHTLCISLLYPPSKAAAASVAFDLYSGASSPTPSVRSNDSQSSFISHLTEKTHWAELTPEFKRRHFLVGLVLSQLSSAFENS